MKTVIFYHEHVDSVIKGWEEGLVDCGIGDFNSISKSKLKTSYLHNTNPDLCVLENPTEEELSLFHDIKKSKEKWICIVGNNYQKFYKNYPFVDLWVEPCFYDKVTEQLFSNDNLPFYYSPNAAWRIPFYTELHKEFDLSTNDPLKENWNTFVIPKNSPHPEIIYGNTKVNLNYEISKKDFVYLNQKTFDIPMSGNFELSTIPEVVDIFEGKVGYTSEPEMRDKINYYLNHDEERERMAIKSYEVIISKHTYYYRMLALLKHLNSQ
jgi:spore maturation protein CgeB